MNGADLAGDALHLHKNRFIFFFLEKGFSFHLSWEDAALPAGRHAGIRGWRQVTVCLKYSSEQV